MMHKWEMDEQRGSGGGCRKHSADPRNPQVIPQVI